MESCEIGYSDFLTLKSIIAKLGYKPGWEVTARDLRNVISHDFAIHVIVKYHVPDADKPDEIREQKFACLLQGEKMPVEFVPGKTEKARWRLWLFCLLLYLEGHEAAEFFTLDGEKPYDPHADPADSVMGRLWPAPYRP
jgi:hypothetical protein